MSRLIELASNHRPRLALPVLTYPGATLVGKRVRDLVTDAASQVEAQAALHRRYGLPVVQTCMDLSVEAEAFGGELMMSDDEPPTVLGRRVTGAESIRDLRVPEVGAGRTGLYLEVARRLGGLPGQPLVLGGMIGPFSLAGRLYGVSESLELTMEDPPLLEALLDKCSEFLTAYALAFKAAGAAGLLMAEPAAGLLSPRSMAACSSPRIRQIRAAVEDDGFTLVYHNCAAKLVHLPAVLETGARVLHFGPPMDVVAALDKVPPAILIGGNLDPSRQLLHATPHEVETATRTLLAATARHNNFLVSSGCDIPVRTPMDNLDAFLDSASRP
ncbi:MAG: methyltransferase [Verrucomicrobia bacterium]|nr:methyltransferase [Verrucomicrobiota bacterium]